MPTKTGAQLQQQVSGTHRQADDPAVDDAGERCAARSAPVRAARSRTARARCAARRNPAYRSAAVTCARHFATIAASRSVARAAASAASGGGSAATASASDVVVAIVERRAAGEQVEDRRADRIDVGPDVEGSRRAAVPATRIPACRGSVPAPPCCVTARRRTDSPKSPTSTRPSRCTKQFDGLMSR